MINKSILKELEEAMKSDKSFAVQYEREGNVQSYTYGSESVHAMMVVALAADLYGKLKQDTSVKDYCSVIAKSIYKEIMKDKKQAGGAS